MRPADKEFTQAVRHYVILAPGVDRGFLGASPSAPTPSPELPLTPRAKSVTARRSPRPHHLSEQSIEVLGIGVAGS